MDQAAVSLVGHDYLVRKIVNADLDGIDPLRLLVAEQPELASQIGQQTIVVVGAHFNDGENGFYEMVHTANPAARDLGSGEEMLDHSCAVLSQPRP